ncbi:src kinase-associated phosphoprotein 2-like [Mobula birostris]|uniref:src kinase-associated phosphoprotein 2-like n=1 Tax=Mobula birostris TaxID=1983395 RepID=UPI003B28763D
MESVVQEKRGGRRGSNLWLIPPAHQRHRPKRAQVPGIPVKPRQRRLQRSNARPTTSCLRIPAGAGAVRLQGGGAERRERAGGFLSRSPEPCPVALLSYLLALGPRSPFIMLLSVLMSAREDHLTVGERAARKETPFEEIPLIAAQELSSVLKQGYLEKKRRDHSFFGSEWRRRLCLLNTNIFYYYSSEKDKQQRGAFYVHDAYLVQNLRKDSKKNCCFEVVSVDKQVYQFTAQSMWEAKEWVDHIQFVRKDMNSSFIPIEEDDEEEEGGVDGMVPRKGEPAEEETYDDVDTPSMDHKPPLGHPQAGTGEIPDDEIYEELPEDDFPPPIPLDEDEEETDSQGTSGVSYEDCYLGLWDCTGEQDDELSFKRGDMIHILSKDYNSFGWWVGELDGTIGIVPKDYLMAAFDI